MQNPKINIKKKEKPLEKCRNIKPSEFAFIVLFYLTFVGIQIILSIEKSYMMGLGCRGQVLKVFAEGNCAFDTVLLYFLKVYAFFLFNVEHVTQLKRDVELYWFNLLQLVIYENYQPSLQMMLQQETFFFFNKRTNPHFYLFTFQKV